MDKLCYPFCRGRIFDYCEKDTHHYDEPMEVFWASGACLFIRADVWKSSGGLYERLFAHMEDYARLIREVHCRFNVERVDDGLLHELSKRNGHTDRSPFENGLDETRHGDQGNDRFVRRIRDVEFERNL